MKRNDKSHGERRTIRAVPDVLPMDRYRRHTDTPDRRLMYRGRSDLEWYDGELHRYVRDDSRTRITAVHLAWALMGGLLAGYVIGHWLVVSAIGDLP